MTNYSNNEILNENEGIFDIDLLNKVTGTTYPQVAVYNINTLGQVVREYGEDLGVNPNDSKILFENKRTGASTSDSDETVEGLGLQEGDVLAISDNAGVAGFENKRTRNSTTDSNDTVEGLGLLNGDVLVISDTGIVV